MISKEEKKYQKTKIKFVLRGFFAENSGKILLLYGNTQYVREVLLEMEMSNQRRVRAYFPNEFFGEIYLSLSENRPADFLIGSTDVLLLENLWEIKQGSYHHSLLEVFMQLQKSRKQNKYIILASEGNIRDIEWMINRYVVDKKALLKIEIH